MGAGQYTSCLKRSRDSKNPSIYKQYVILVCAQLSLTSVVAVSPFKVALQLESKRRENDEKISALFMLMKEMMDTLRMYVLSTVFTYNHMKILEPGCQKILIS